MTLLRDLGSAFASEEASRRAAYHVMEWSKDLPEVTQLGGAGAYRHMLERLLHYQFARQKLGKEKKHTSQEASEIALEHASRLAQAAPLDKPAKDIAAFINNHLAVAEFLAREVRS